MCSQLFQSDNKSPLADMLRPKDFTEIIGQEHLLNKEGVLLNFSNTGYLPSIILYGPAGCGKTTIARIIIEKSNYEIEIASAVSSGVADLKNIFEKAKAKKQDGLNTILFVDEIHRFNRSQQDVFLPHLEDGTITLIGATTENPSFELNSALLSRCKVLVLKRLEENSLLKIIETSEVFFKKKLPIEEKLKFSLCNMADGDGRTLLNICEELFNLKSDKTLNKEELSDIIQKQLPTYDKHQDGHYNLISALHKSLRGSDVNAALYWTARMLEAGENPLYITRRLVRFASEDIGLADPNALVQALSAKDACQFLGSTEGELAIFQAVAYLATAPKSNAIYTAEKAVRIDAKEYGSLMPPKHILNAPTKFMKEQGYGEGYIYDPDTEKGFSGQDYFPEDMGRKEYYKPFERGFEREIIKRLNYWDKIRKG